MFSSKAVVQYSNSVFVFYLFSQEAFSVAKLAFRDFKSKVRRNLSATHIGPETLEEAVQDYINRNLDLYDLPTLISVRTWVPAIFIIPHMMILDSGQSRALD